MSRPGAGAPRGLLTVPCPPGRASGVFGVGGGSVAPRRGGSKRLDAKKGEGKEGFGEGEEMAGKRFGGRGGVVGT